VTSCVVGRFATELANATSSGESPRTQTSKWWAGSLFHPAARLTSQGPWPHMWEPVRCSWWSSQHSHANDVIHITSTGLTSNCYLLVLLQPSCPSVPGLLVTAYGRLRTHYWQHTGGGDTLMTANGLFTMSAHLESELCIRLSKMSAAEVM